MKNLISFYLLPKPNYFTEGYRGRVMHALGCAYGLSYNNVITYIFSSSNLTQYSSYFHSLTRPVSVNTRKQLWHLSYLFTVINNHLKIKPDIVIARYSMSSSVLLVVYFLFIHAFGKRQTRVCLEVNSLYIHSNSPNPLLCIIFSKIESLLFNLSDSVYSVSQALSDHLSSNVTRSKIITIANGAFDSPQLSKYVPVPKGSAKKRFIYFGSFHKYYNFQILINAFASFSAEIKPSLVFFGKGDLEPFITSSTQENDNIFYEGSFTPQCLPDILNPKTDILILPPKTGKDLLLSGGLSTKVFEYMSTSFPLLLPYQSELKQIFIDKRDCFFYDVDSQALQNTILNDILPCESFTDVGLNSYNKFKSTYSWPSRMKILINRLSSFK